MKKMFATLLFSAIVLVLSLPATTHACPGGMSTHCKIGDVTVMTKSDEECAKVSGEVVKVEEEKACPHAKGKKKCSKCKHHKGDKAHHEHKDHKEHQEHSATDSAAAPATP